ncbi:cTAGE family member 15-like [Sturnira hondurensis]|uniref:cTAGE family member 15-like n=1 Tax=Sturnira hondurensis TaxID=192404 RepID=UPI00187A2949|nr:cTAGE family member 15-like [Sturnira hondurensis]
MEGLVPATAMATASTFQLILEHLCAILLLISESLGHVPALAVLLSVILVGTLVVVSLMVKRRHMSGSVKAPEKRCPAREEACARRSENTGPMTEADDTPKPPGVEAGPLWLQTLCLKALNEHLSRMSSLQDLADLVRTVRRTQPPGHSCVPDEKPVTKAPGTGGEQLQENMPGDLNKNTRHPESPEVRQEETVEWKQDVQDEEEEKQGPEPSTAPVEWDLQGADEEDQGRARELWEQKQISEELAAEIRSLQTEKASLRCENTDLNAEIQQLKLKLRVQPDTYEDRLTRLQKQVLEAERRCSEMEEKLLDDGRNMKSTYEMLSTYKKMAQDMHQELRRSTFYYEKEIRYHWERAEAAWKAAESTERKLQELWRENDRHRQLLARAQFTFQPFPGGPFAPAAPPAAYRGPEVPVCPLGPQFPRKEQGHAGA